MLHAPYVELAMTAVGKVMIKALLLLAAGGVGYCGPFGGQEKRKLPRSFDRGSFYKKPGNTYSRTFGTTIGSGSLTTVFGMGTGVAFQI